MATENKKQRVGMQESVALIALSTIMTDKDKVDEMISLAKSFYEENFAGKRSVSEFASTLAALIHIFSSNVSDAGSPKDISTHINKDSDYVN